jgi:hypothetical protein
MSGVPWIRVDTAMFEHPKFLYLEEEGQYKAMIVHLKGMTYSGRHGLAGFVPRVALAMLGACLDDAQTLVDACLWTPQPGGWIMHGWDEYQPVSEEAQKRSEKAHKAAVVRWSKRNGATTGGSHGS